MAPRRERFIQARKAAGYTQEGLAEALHVDRTTIARWDRGKSEPQPHLRPKLSRLLGVSREELSELLTPVLSTRYSRIVDLEPTRLAASSPESAYLESVELNRQLEASDLGPRTLVQLDLTIERLGQDYLRVPPLQTFSEAHLTRRYVLSLLDGKHTRAQRKHLHSIIGWLSALIGLVSFDTGHRFDVVGGHLEAALHIADEVNHGELIAWIRGTQALVAIFHDRPQVAVQLAQAGRKAAPQDSIMTVRLLTQEARAQARLGNPTLSEQCLAGAERCFDRVTDSLSASIFSFDRPYLPYYAGTCYAWLQQPNLAMTYSREAIVLCDEAAKDWPVARVFARADLADALIQRNKLESARELARECLDICNHGRRTDPTKTRVLGVLNSLRARMGVSPVRELEERARAVFSEGEEPTYGT